MRDRDSLFGVYIHWPFCAQKCPYCDFNSHVRFGGWDEGRFLAAYKRELDAVAAITKAAGSAQGRPVTSIFFGGGTPSLMKPETVAAILDHVAGLWAITPGAEITIEANPGSVEAERFKGYRAAGVNRVSIGLQSLRDDQLKKLGRIHTVAEAKSAFAIARRTFDRTSFDLIYARPGQTPADWREELAEALQLASDHVSLYQLTIEPDTPFAALHAAGKLVVPDPDAALELYEITQEMTAAKGLAAYEISNYARPGSESHHNLTYWRYGEYAGIGPGAHGRLVPTTGHSGDPNVVGIRLATVAERNPEAWAARVERDGHGFVETVELKRGEQADEMLLMGLRLSEGISLDRLATVGGVRPSDRAIAGLVGLGLIEQFVDASHASIRGQGVGHDEISGCIGPGVAPEPGGIGSCDAGGLRVRATARGRFVLNAVVAELSASFESVAPADRGQTIDGRLSKPA